MTKNRRRSFDWKTQLNWRDMLIDAPAAYSPHWLGAIKDERLAAHCQRLYMELRKDADNGNGVSLMRDLVLRRITWSVRILERIEQAIVYWSDELDAGGDDFDAEEMLVGYMKFHTHQLKELATNINIVLVEMPPLKTVEQAAASRTPNRDKVTFLTDEEMDDD